MYLRTGSICSVDLATGDSSTSDLPEDLAGQDSALVIMERLHGENPDSVIMGTGLLTGSLIPAACASVVTSMSSEGMTTMPILGHAGLELKLSGFDFIIVKGVSERLSYLWVRDGIAEVVDAQDLSGMDSWARTDKIRADQGDRKIQVLSCGPWGDRSENASSLVVNYWLGEDEAGLASVFGRKRLAAVAFRGMGELEVSDPESHFTECLALRREHISKLGSSRGLESYTEIAGKDEFSSLLHRIVGCYGCPHPCRSYLKIAEDSGVMALAHKEPGYLHYDIPALHGTTAAGMSVRDATAAMMESARQGADTLSVLARSGADLARFRSALSSAQDIPRAGHSSIDGSFRTYQTYDQALALGLCPRYWGKVGLDVGSISKCAEPALGRPMM
jgi:aldehyde:ferredoxin oxidoreductase